MRVALLTYNARFHDAIGNQVAEKLAFFLDSGADVRVFVGDGQRLHPFVRPHCRLLDPREPKGEGWKYLTSSDLIIADYSQAYALLNLLPLLAGGKPRIVLDYHGVTPPDLWGSNPPEALTEGLRKRGLIWSADACLTHSRCTRRELLEHTHFPEDRTFAVGYPVPSEQWSAGPPVQDLRDKLRIGEARVLLYVGRLAPNKRLPVLVEALALLREEQPPVHAVVVGDSGDLYQEEAGRGREQAARAGVADRLHILGQLSISELRDAYRSADVFVMPSRHEGFGIPVIEAMACGVPVVAARATALPETVASAGLTFTPDDSADLAHQVRRALLRTGEPEYVSTRVLTQLRIAVVSARYGEDFIGGAERSLRTLAETLSRAGHIVEVFATCANSEMNWTDHYPEGVEKIGGATVRRFRIDPHDRARHMEAVRAILQANGAVSEQIAEQYLAHSIHSQALMAALRERINDFDAVVVGPYLLGLTHDVTTAFPTKTVLLPCFHDEPFARLAVWREVYEGVAGLLYHSPEEQDLAGCKLGINHPGGVCLGTWIDTETAGDAARGRALVGGDCPYVVYCGRYSMQKGLPALIDCARHYSQRHPGWFTFVFMGDGNVSIPAEPWARDLGFVSEEVKRDVLAAAAAVVQLSRCESLSLVALEAWAQAVPVIVNRRCPALLGHVQRGGGGRAVDDSDSLAEALDDLHAHPASWQALGQKGQEYVVGQYGSQADYLTKLEAGIREVSAPLSVRMRRRGFERAAQFDRPQWRQALAEFVENVLDAQPRGYREQLDIQPRGDTRHAVAGAATILVPVRVINQGTHVVVAEGPAQTQIVSSVIDEQGCPQAAEIATPLPGMLVPRQALAVAIPVAVPAKPGTYGVTFEARFAATGHKTDPPVTPFSRKRKMTLVVQEGAAGVKETVCAPLVEAMRGALAEAYRLRQLPDDYVDVSEGRFASWKRWIKQKLLGNFKRAYVDALSRQQSAFNQQVIASLTELIECCATLDHAQSAPQPAPAELEKTLATLSRSDDLAHLLHNLVENLNDSRRLCTQLQARLDRMEAQQAAAGVHIAERGVSTLD